jgi:signal transduction histidine kinase
LNLENYSLPALAAQQKEIILVKDARNEQLVDKNFLDVINVDEFLCVPLLARDEILGEIIIDNAITRLPIEAKDIKLASICGLMAGNYIHMNTLHKRMIEMEKQAALGEMAMFITHQLRNPLVAIGGFTDQMIQSPQDEDKRTRNLEIIRREIKRLEDIVFKLAHFLKVDIKTPIPFEFQPVLHKILQSSDIQWKSQGKTIHVDIEEGHIMILCDPTYLGEALLNILDNALDATPKGGEILVRGYRENSAWFVLSIKDSGAGMSDADLQKLFIPFSSTKENGLGLGLVFVKRIMDLCGGRIEVESAENKGTEFKLFFKCPD